MRVVVASQDIITPVMFNEEGTESLLGAVALEGGSCWVSTPLGRGWYPCAPEGKPNRRNLVSCAVKESCDEPR